MDLIANFKPLNVIFFFQKLTIRSYSELYDCLSSFMLKKSIQQSLDSNGLSFSSKFFESENIGAIINKYLDVSTSNTESAESKFVIEMTLLFLQQNAVSIITLFDEFLYQTSDLLPKLSLRVFSHTLFEIAINRLILTVLNIDKYFIVGYYSDLLEDSAKSSPNRHFFISDDLVTDLKSPNMLGCWTILITTFNMTIYESKDIRQNNIKALMNGTIRPDFYFDTMHQIYYFLPIIREINQGMLTKNTSSLEKILANRLRIAYFIDKGVKKGQVKKYKFYQTNDKIHYFPIILISEHETDVPTQKRLFYKEYDIFFQGSNDAKVFSDNRIVLEEYKAFCTKQNLFYLDDHTHFLMYYYRDLMVDFIAKFLALQTVISLQADYNVSLKFPSSKIIDINYIYDNQSLNTLLQRERMTYPLLIKFGGYQPNCEHKMSIILSEEGFINYANSVRLLNPKEERNLIIQEYSNHGGFILKIYRINHTNYCYFRPSTPDLYPEVSKLKEFSKGYYDFETAFLSTKEFSEFWAKFDNKAKVKSSFNLKFLEKIAEEFEKASNNTLFGLDIIYDYQKDIHYFIDCNYFPAYTELDKETDPVLTEHVIKQWLKFKTIN